ncbi:N-acetylmuramoyl-L-alanine amidase [Actinoplanes sp. G11-F43]|uniref:N-acetylmuramoyl-L-alanine amidase n=1 Tax=Actinoplanes sp. G11-F43 TaxID=3424130 RepID=UPI003D356E7B
MRRNRLTAHLAATTGALAVVLSGSMAAPHPPAAGPGAAAGGAAAAVRRPASVLQTLPLIEARAFVPVAARPGGRSATRVAVLPQRATGPFSLVGVTWADPRTTPAGTMEIRTRSAETGDWTAWQPLETDNPDASAGAEGPAVRGASDPLWVGPSDGVQARVVAAGAADPFPKGLRVDLINPEGVDHRVDHQVGSGSLVLAGNSAREEEKAGREKRKREGRKRAGKGRRGERAAPVVPARPVPRMVTRAGWRADESMVIEPPEYTGAVHVVFVHHTASGNAYDCAQSAAIVRGIEAFHVRSKGWNDIGYNFLVDKCGRIFEGRAGGVHRSVLGAHTLGFNENASAVAVIGDHRSTAVSTAARAAVAQLAAYKLGAWGNPPLGRAGLVSGGSDRYPKGRTAVLNRISAHRDTGRTECPGDSLYAQLPAIRAIAGAAPARLRYRGVNGAREYAGRYYTRSAAGPAWNLDTPSRMMDRFEVYVGGRLAAAAPSGHRQAGVRLTPGTHRVTVRAIHLSGRITSTSATVVADPVAPRFTGTPLASLREGAVGRSAPVRVSWSVSDTSGLSAVEVSGSTTGTLPGTAVSLPGSARLGDPATWTVTATDRAGNPAADTVTRTPVLLTEAEAIRAGTWRTVRDQGHLGGEAVVAATAGASLSWTFTGTSAALVAGRTATSGRVRIYVDEEFQGVVDLRSASPQHARAVWTRTWRSAGAHTVRVQAEGTSGRPSVVLDGLVHLR